MAGSLIDALESLGFEIPPENRISPIPPPSDEQQAIIDDIGRGRSVIVNAVPGSGKTTTVLQVASAFPSKRMFLVTYNRKLKDDTAMKISISRLSNISAYTYHGLATRSYSTRK